jgi:hypothetical protein
MILRLMLFVRGREGGRLADGEGTQQEQYERVPNPAVVPPCHG